EDGIRDFHVTGVQTCALPISASDAWVQEVHMWDALARQETIMPGEEITLGFDGSRANDATALVACRVSDGFIQPLEIWQPQGERSEERRVGKEGKGTCGLRES